MSTRIVYSSEVKRNISDIAKYTEREWGRSKRIILIKQIADSMELIAEFPRNAKFDIDLGLHYRLVTGAPLLIVYGVEHDIVRIIKIIHTKRNR
jgi:plasmid stabilization system protein ParE